MSLTPIPVTSIFNKSADPWFNHDAAEWVYETVSKMDDETAEMFTYLVGCEMLDADIQNNLRTLQRHLDEVVTKRIDQIKKAVFTVSKARGAVDEGFADAVQRIEEICKDDTHRPHNWDRDFREADVRRNARGQFSQKIHVDSSMRLLPKERALALGVPDDHYEDVRGGSKSQYQQEYLQLAQFLNDFQNRGGDPATDRVLLTVQNKNNNNVYTVPMLRGERPDHHAWNPNNERVLSVTAQPKSVSVGNASFNLGQALGMSSEDAQQLGHYTHQINSQLPGFATSWASDHPDDILNTNARTYRRVAGTASFVGAVAPPGSKVQAAAKLAELVGTHGPEAEKVVGPHMRKTSYRYRGTQKEPDPALVRSYEAALNNAKARSRDGGVNPRGISQMAAERVADAKRIPTWDERTAGREAAVRFFNTKLPDRRLYGLNLAGGNTPPSQGVIIDKDGKIVTEAVGYGDDHYLPFNLKHLTKLKGGEYIRTRSVGGPTAEDIYTGLMTGARQVTVTSRSGTFTVQFDETFRGGRRYNDKAKRMVDRYEHLLDAVESEQVDNQPVRREVKEQIEREVKEQYSSYPKVEQRRIYNQKIDEYKTFDGLDEHDQAVIDYQMSRMDTADLPDREVKHIRSQLVADAMAEKEFKFRLNGEGYNAALKALQEQFPYYITTSYQRKVDEEKAPEPERDKGYVMPRHNRPAGALHGYFNPRIAGEGVVAYSDANRKGKMTGKVSAADANYQNMQHRSDDVQRLSNEATQTGAGGQTGERMPGEVTPNDPARPRTVARGRITPVTIDNPAMTPADQLAEQMLLSTRTNDYKAAMWRLFQPGIITWDPNTNYNSQTAILAQAGDKSAFDAYLDTADGRKDARSLVTGFETQFARFNKPALDAIKNADSYLDRPTWTPGNTDFGDKPFQFEGKAYAQSADPSMINRELGQQVPHTLPLTANMAYTSMSPDQLAKEHAALKLLKDNASALRSADATEFNRVVAPSGIIRSDNAMKMLTDDSIDEMIERLQRVRTLNSNLGSAQPTPPVGPPATPPATPPTTTPPAGGPPPAPPAATPVGGGTITPVAAPAPPRVHADPAIVAALIQPKIDALRIKHGSAVAGGDPVKRALRAHEDAGLLLIQNGASNDQALDWANQADQLLS